jgi:hypothetical protein
MKLMKPLSVQLSLLLQNAKKTINKNLYSEAVEAQKIGKRIFGLKTLYLLDSSVQKSSESITSISTVLGYYEWEYDILRLFYKHIRVLSEKYGLNYKAIFQFCLCHEVGHAKEQRMFEGIGYFPNKFKMFPEGVIVEIESTKYHLTSFQVSGKQFWDVFSCGILDFAINKELSKNRMINELSRSMILDTSAQQTQIEGARQTRILESLLLLPHNIDIHQHGELLEDEKRRFEESQKAIVGDKWDSALDILRDIEYSNPENTLNKIIEMFNKILGINAFLSFPIDRNSLFRDYSVVPKYWSKDNYRVIFL